MKIDFDKIKTELQNPTKETWLKIAVVITAMIVTLFALDVLLHAWAVLIPLAIVAVAYYALWYAWKHIENNSSIY